MRSVSRKAPLFVLGVCLLGILTLVYASLIPIDPPVRLGSHPNVQRYAQHLRWVLCLLAILLSRVKIPLPRRDMSISPGPIFSFSAILLFGPAYGVLVAVLGALTMCLWPRPIPLHQLAFNLSVAVIDTWTSGAVVAWIVPHAESLFSVRAIVGFTAAGLVGFVLNTGMVATAIALYADEDPVEVWKTDLLWTFTTYLLEIFLGALAVQAFRAAIVHASESMAYDLVLFLVVGCFIILLLSFMFQYWSVYVARINEGRLNAQALQSSHKQLADLYLATVESLALAIDAKDQSTHRHIQRVQLYAMATAQKMELHEDCLRAVETGALLHDIGKLGVPEPILLKPGRLTRDEYAMIKRHPEIGAAILEPVPFPWDVIPVVKSHHEKWNGQGYPEGLQGEEIPITARILAIADAYDVLTSARTYQTAKTHEEAMEIIRKDAGSHFDPAVVEAFKQVIEPVIQQMQTEGWGPLYIEPAPEVPEHSKTGDPRQASSELIGLYHFLQSLSSNLGLDETLNILLDKLEAILPDTTCVVLMRGDEEDTLTARAVIGPDAEFFRGARTAGPQSRTVLAARNKESYVGPYDPDDLVLRSGTPQPLGSPGSSMIVSIIDHLDKILGAINLYRRSEQAFKPDDQHLVEMVAHGAAMALYSGLEYDRKRSEALTDPLTNLYNLRYLTEWIERRSRVSARIGEHLPHLEEDYTQLLGSEEQKQALQIAPRRASDDFAMLFLDLDRFKLINDTHGHPRGDQVLRALGEVFRNTVREGDVVARYGGDEFLIILNGAGRAEAAKMVDRLQRAVQELDPTSIHATLAGAYLGVSIGFACFPDDGEDCATLLCAADLEMYHNKTRRKLRETGDDGTSVRASDPLSRNGGILTVGGIVAQNRAHHASEEQEAVVTGLQSLADMPSGRWEGDCPETAGQSPGGRLGAVEALRSAQARSEAGDLSHPVPEDCTTSSAAGDPAASDENRLIDAEMSYVHWEL